MSTTVIASPHGPSLALAPWLRRQVDEHALSEVLARYGLELLPGGTDGTEFIAAQGLSHPKAARLAADLRALGLVVRVVNKTGITGSNRVGGTMAGLFGAGIFLFTAVAGLASENQELLALLPMAGIAFAALNLLTLQMRGGSRLAVASAEPETHADGEVALLVEELRSLRAELPDHLVEPLLARAEGLGTEGHESAGELASLAAEVRADRDQRAAEEIRVLREQLRQAKRAAAELNR